jgi:hypothetical protein
MEPNTHAFANDNVDVMNWDKAKVPYAANGSEAGWMVRGKRDIGDKQIDEEVAGFGNADTNVLPQPWRRSETPPKATYIPSPEEKSLSQSEGQYH